MGAVRAAPPSGRAPVAAAPGQAGVPWFALRSRRAALMVPEARCRAVGSATGTAAGSRPPKVPGFGVELPEPGSKRPTRPELGVAWVNTQARPFRCVFRPPQ
ncbi:unnamed protein product [Coccothraustes coccothraustes]